MSTQDEQIEYYNERWAGTDYANLYCQQRCMFFLKALLDIGLKEPRICDLGCGTGWLTAVLSAFGPCTGLELSPRAVELANRKYPTARFLAGDATIWEPPPGSFDVVVSQEVIEHIVDKPAYLAVARKALRDGGYLFMTTPNRGVLDAVPTEERKRVWEIQPVELPVDRRELNALLASAGFRVEATSSLVDGMGRTGIDRFVNSVKLHSVLRMFGVERMWTDMLLRNNFGMYMTTVARKL